MQVIFLAIRLGGPLKPGPTCEYLILTRARCPLPSLVQLHFWFVHFNSPAILAMSIALMVGPRGVSFQL